MSPLKRLLLASTIGTVLLGSFATPALADFGFAPGSMSAAISNQNATPVTAVGSHPFQVSVRVAFNQTTNSTGEVIPDGDVKDLVAALPPGLIGNATVPPQCSSQDFHTPSPTNLYNGASCPIDTQIGVALVSLAAGESHLALPVYNLVPAYGVPAEFGFNPLGLGIQLTPSLRGGIGSDYGLNVTAADLSQTVGVLASTVTIWGVPDDHAHDTLRGECLNANPDVGSNGSCPLSEAEQPKPFLTMPTSCTGPLRTTASADSWQQPGARLPDGSPDLSDPTWKTESVLSLDNEGNPIGLDGCNQLPFTPEASGLPTTDSASSPTGFDFNLDIDDPGLTDVNGSAQSQIKKAVVTLPEGMSVNPSAGEGLSGCTPAQLASETLQSAPGAGCPNSSKIGEVTISTPLLSTPVPGSLYVAKQGENPFGSLLALYIVAKDPATGILVKLAGRVEPDPQTGRLTTTFDNLPQLPFSHFNLHFREGQRSPLITPPACGTYTVKADLTPWSNPGQVLHDTSDFTITKGVAGGPCPSGALPPFHPQLLAGTTNNAAGRFSPFYTRISRTDGEQEITHFSIKLPPGLAGILAGIPACPEAAIAAAKGREHEGGGSEEQLSPSCSPASEVGHSLVGSGVGSVLAYAPGKIYLAGPYHGAPISLVSITAAKVGPFDLGTVVVRFALRIDPDTAEVFVDSTGSDPIPHIIDGIPVHLREIRAYVDRPGFIFNPTSCERTSTASTVLGSGLDFVSAADDVPLTISSPFQSADCAALPFKPKLKLSLKGNMKRTGAPAFRAELTMKPGEANIARSLVTLPRSELLYNAHIQNACGIGSFRKTGSCPPDSVYGRVMAISPVFDEPLEGPVYLMGGLGHKLPDLYGVLKNAQAEIHLDGIVSGLQRKRHGEAFSLIRNAFEALPDAPVSKFVLEMDGGPKGLLQNGTNLCADTHRAISEFSAHSGKVYDTKPVVVATGCKGTKKGGKRHRHRAR